MVSPSPCCTTLLSWPRRCPENSQHRIAMRYAALRETDCGTPATHTTLLLLQNQRHLQLQCQRALAPEVTLCTSNRTSLQKGLGTATLAIEATVTKVHFR